jgi:hypothetical protein
LQGIQALSAMVEEMTIIYELYKENGSGVFVKTEEIPFLSLARAERYLQCLNTYSGERYVALPAVVNENGLLLTPEYIEQLVQSMRGNMVTQSQIDLMLDAVLVFKRRLEFLDLEGVFQDEVD